MTAADLRSIRTRLGMTQRDLALAVGMMGRQARRHVRAWEDGLETIPPQIESKIRNLVPEEA